MRKHTTLHTSNLLKQHSNNLFKYNTFKGLLTLYLNSKLRDNGLAINVTLTSNEEYFTLDTLTDHQRRGILQLILHLETNIQTYYNTFNKVIGYVETTAREKDSDNTTGTFMHIVFYTESLYDKYVQYFLDFDFKSVMRTGRVNLLHFTAKENIKGILSQGFLPQSWVGDLGLGVYCIPQKDTHALHNVTRYFLSLEDDEDDQEDEGIDENPDGHINTLCAMSFKYEGVYLQCISGSFHENYIVIPFNSRVLPLEVTSSQPYLNYSNLHMDLYD